MHFFQIDCKGKEDSPYTVVWDSKTAKRLVTIHFHETMVTTCCFTFDGKYLLTVGVGAEGMTAALWDWQANIEVGEGQDARVFKMPFPEQVEKQRKPLFTFLMAKDGTALCYCSVAIAAIAVALSRCRKYL